MVLDPASESLDAVSELSVPLVLLPVCSFSPSLVWLSLSLPSLYSLFACDWATPAASCTVGCSHSFLALSRISSYFSRPARLPRTKPAARPVRNISFPRMVAAPSVSDARASLRCPYPSCPFGTHGPGVSPRCGAPGIPFAPRGRGHVLCSPAPSKAGAARSPIAQLAEQPAVNRQVIGSSPIRGASPRSGAVSGSSRTNRSPVDPVALLSQRTGIRLS